MKKFKVNLQDIVTYHNIEAETAEEAADIALEYWYERMPLWLIEEEKEEKE